MQRKKFAPFMLGTINSHQGFISIGVRRFYLQDTFICCQRFFAIIKFFTIQARRIQERAYFFASIVFFISNSFSSATDTVTITVSPASMGVMTPIIIRGCGCSLPGKTPGPRGPLGVSLLMGLALMLRRRSRT